MMLIPMGNQRMGFLQTMGLHQRPIAHNLVRRPIRHHMTLID
jgi:hypothetical protein